MNGERSAFIVYDTTAIVGSFGSDSITAYSSFMQKIYAIRKKGGLTNGKQMDTSC